MCCSELQICKCGLVLHIEDKKETELQVLVPHLSLPYNLAMFSTKQVSHHSSCLSLWVVQACANAAVLTSMSTCSGQTRHQVATSGFLPIALTGSLTQWEAPHFGRAASPVSFLHLSIWHPSVGVTGMYSHARLITRVLEIQILVLILAEQGLLPTESSSQMIGKIWDESKLSLLIKIGGFTEMRGYLFLFNFRSSLFKGS